MHRIEDPSLQVSHQPDGAALVDFDLRARVDPTLAVLAAVELGKPGVEQQVDFGRSSVIVRCTVGCTVAGSTMSSPSALAAVSNGSAKPVPSTSIAQSARAIPSTNG
jgi:hypothetical protein